MGSWDWDLGTDEWRWDEGQHRIFGVEPSDFKITAENIRALIHPDDWSALQLIARGMAEGTRTQQTEFRVLRSNGEIRWCLGTAAASVDGAGKVVRISGVTIDVTDRKEAEERQVLLAREVDHRARNALAIIQSIIRLTRAKSVDDYVATVEGRIKALALAHTLLSDSRWHGADLGTLVKMCIRDSTCTSAMARYWRLTIRRCLVCRRKRTLRSKADAPAISAFWGRVDSFVSFDRRRERRPCPHHTKYRTV